MVPPLAVGPSASLVHFLHFAVTVRHSSSFLGRADILAWPWLSAGGRCCCPVATRYTAQEGLVAARPCLQVGNRQWADISAGAPAAGGDDLVEQGRKLRARWSCAFRRPIRP